MVKVWCKFKQNQTKAIKVTEQKPQMLTESWNHGMMDMLKPVYTPKTLFCGGIIICVQNKRIYSQLELLEDLTTAPSEEKDQLVTEN